MIGGYTGDHFLDQHGLADSGATEQADLAAFFVRRQKVDYLDAGFEHLCRRLKRIEGRRISVDVPALGDLKAVNGHI